MRAKDSKVQHTCGMRHADWGSTAQLGQLLCKRLLEPELGVERQLYWVGLTNWPPNKGGDPQPGG